MTKLSPKNDCILTAKEVKLHIELTLSNKIGIPAIRQLAYRKKIKAQKHLGRLFFSKSSVLKYTEVREMK